MANRLYYAAQAVSINGSVITGVQSLGISTTYNLEPVFQLGRLSVYEDVQDLADVEVTISKLINGTAPLYLMCTASSSGSSGSSGLGLGTGQPLNTLAERTCDVTVTAFDDTATNLDENTRTAVNAVTMTGMYLSNVSYTLPVEGNLTEDVTLIGQNHSTTTGSAAFPGPGGFVGRRQMVSGTGSGTQQVTISVDLSREPLYQLGTFNPTVRLLNFPVEVTSEWESLATAAGAGSASAVEPGCSSYGSSTGVPLSVTICNGASSGSSGSSGSSNNQMTINLGSNNVVTSVNYSGGDAGGGNVTVTTSYRNYNSFSITVTGTFLTLT